MLNVFMVGLYEGACNRKRISIIRGNSASRDGAIAPDCAMGIMIHFFCASNPRNYSPYKFQR